LYCTLNRNFFHTQSSFSKPISKSAIATCTIWSALQAQHTPSTIDKIFKRLWKTSTFAGIFYVVGGIDGMHTRNECTSNPGSQYFNYKQYHSTVLQAGVDAYLKFATMDVGAYGKTKQWWGYLMFTLETQHIH
jgi:hypothetical protein